MPIETIIEILSGYKKYLNIINRFDDIVIKEIQCVRDVNDYLILTLMDHMGSSFKHKAFIHNGELHILNDDGDDLIELNYSEYEYLTIDEVNYIRKIEKNSKKEEKNGEKS